MRRFFHMFLSALAVLLAVSCEESAPLEENPVKPLLTADKLNIFANGADVVTFTVTLDGNDVTSKSQISVDGLGMSGCTFKTSAPGRYVFKAVADGVESDAVIVEATAIEISESEFHKHVAVWEFTGAWCTFCPSGYSNMNFVISTSSFYKDYVHIMAFHSGSSGLDELGLEETDRIMSDMNVGDGFPSFLTELRTSGGLSDGGAFKASLVEAFDENPAHCGVAVASELTDGKVKAEVKVHSELSSSYRVAVFVVEDNVKYYQKDGSLTHEEYNHRHVVRKILSASYMGDRLGDIKDGEEGTRSYEFEMNPAWNPDNTYIYALAINFNGHVNNMQICKVGDTADYNRI